MDHREGSIPNALGATAPAGFMMTNPDASRCPTNRSAVIWRHHLVGMPDPPCALIQESAGQRLGDFVRVGGSEVVGAEYGGGLPRRREQDENHPGY